MNIGLVCPYNLNRGGGVQEGIIAIRQELARRGHTAKIITPSSKGIEPAQWPAVTFVGVAKDIKSPFATTAQISVSLKPEEIDALFKREQFDILHFHEPWVPVMCRQLLSKSDAINVATFHARLPDTIMSKTVEAVVTPYTKPLLKHLDALTAVSDAAAEYVRSLTSQPITIIPNGVNLKKYESAGTKRGKSTGKKTIVYVGRLEKRKGVRYLLDAFAALQQVMPDTRLVIAGDGPGRDKLEQQAKSLGLKNVKFAGFVDEEAKLKLLAGADLFCSPAIYGESFGIVLLEAMAMGVPIVAGDNPGYTSVMQGRGKLSLVDPKDVDKFASRMKIFLDDTELRKLWCAWAKDYVQQFDYSKIVDQYENLYKNLIKGKKRKK